jgi:hypothetical protein
VTAQPPLDDPAMAADASNDIVIVLNLEKVEAPPSPVHDMFDAPAVGASSLFARPSSHRSRK